jgi:hypothetical protein
MNKRFKINNNKKNDKQKKLTHNNVIYNLWAATTSNKLVFFLKQCQTIQTF